MKKKLLFIFICLISVFMFNSSVNAVVMWMDCGEYDSQYNNITVGVDDNDYYKYRYFAIANDKNNKPRSISFINKDNVLESIVNNGSEKTAGVTYIDYLGSDSTSQNASGYMIWVNPDGFFKFKTENFHAEYNNHISMVLEKQQGEKYLREGKCPEAVKKSDTSGGVRGDFIVLGGSPQNGTIGSQLDKENFIIYENNNCTFLEGYDKDGRYFMFTNCDKNRIDELFPIKDDAAKWLVKPMDKEYGGDGNNYHYDKSYISWFGASQIIRMLNAKENYFDVVNNKNARISSITSNTSIELKYDSNDTNKKMQEMVSSAYEKNKEQYEESYDNLMLLREKKDLYNAAEGINNAFNSGNLYSFSSGYSVENAISDLEESQVILDKFINKEFKFTTSDGKDANDFNSAVLWDILSDAFGVGIVSNNNGKSNENFLKSFSNFGTVENYSVAQNVLYTSISQKVNEISGKTFDDMSNVDTEINDFVVKYAVVAKYLSNNADKYGLTSSQIDRIKKLKEKYDLISSSLGIEVVVDCESLIGDALKVKLQSYIDTFKIAIPIILIVFGILDFTKAIFAGDEEKMRKAQKDFIKRIAISVLIFIMPIIVDLLLNIANQVWNFISPNSCDIFYYSK